MKVRFIGETDTLCLINGKIYEVISIECHGQYRIVDETEDDYLYSPKFFEVVEE